VQDLIKAEELREFPKFWRWFQDNSEVLKRIRSADAPEYNELQRRVARLSPEIEAEIGGFTSKDDLNLVFNAHGDRRYFSLIDEIVKSAPHMDGWCVRALKPPLLENLRVQYGDQEITTQEIWLKVGSGQDTESRLQLIVAIQHENDANQNWSRESAALLAIESFLGERVYSLSMFIDGFVDLPNNPRAEGFVSLWDIANQLQLSGLE
jgi:hypothetical protein